MCSYRDLNCLENVRIKCDENAPWTVIGDRFVLEWAVGLIDWTGAQIGTLEVCNHNENFINGLGILIYLINSWRVWPVEGPWIVMRITYRSVTGPAYLFGPMGPLRAPTDRRTYSIHRALYCAGMCNLQNDRIGYQRTKNPLTTLKVLSSVD